MQFLPTGSDGPAMLAMGWDGKLWLLQLRPLSGVTRTLPLEPSRHYAWSPPSVHQEWMDSDNAEFRSRLQPTRVESVAVAAETVVASDLVDQVAFFAPRGGAHRAILQVPAFGERFDFQQVALSPSAHRLAIGRRFQVCLWHLENDHWVSDGRILGAPSFYYGDSMWALGFLDETHLVALCSDGIRRYRFQDQDYRMARGADLPTHWEAAALSGGQVALYCRGRYFLVDLWPQEARTLDQWTGGRPDCLAIASGGTVAWSVAGRLFLRWQRQSREFEALPIGSEPLGIGFVQEPYLYLTRQDRSLIVNWQSLESWKVQVPGPILGGWGNHLFCRTQQGFAALDFLSALGL